MQGILKQTLSVIKAEFDTDLRRPTVLAAAGLQVFALALLCYLSNTDMNARIWNSMFWLTVIFASIQAASKGFIGVSKARWIYLNQLASPFAYIAAKIVYSWAVMILICILDIGVFSFFSGNPIQHPLYYFTFILLVSGGLGTIFTLISAIASKTTQPGYLVPVLSLPVLLPILLIGVKASVKCVLKAPIPASIMNTDMLLLAAFDLLLLVLAGVLFGALWRD